MRAADALMRANLDRWRGHSLLAPIATHPFDLRLDEDGVNGPTLITVLVRHDQESGKPRSVVHHGCRSAGHERQGEPVLKRPSSDCSAI